MVKVCPKCEQKSVVKNGMQRGKQAYKCGLCKHRFIGKSRDRGKSTMIAELWREYTQGKQTYEQIGNKIGRSKKTVQRIFDKEIVRVQEFYNETLNKIPVFIIADCTRCGDNCFFVIKSHEHRKVLYAIALDGEENVKAYTDGIRFLKEKGRIIKGITCDGFSGLRKALAGIPFQLCQFHQVKNVVKYLTKKPKNIAGRDLLNITYQLKTSTYEKFSKLLEDWYVTHKDHMDEKTETKSKTGKKKSRYTHRRLRSAYNSLRNNMPVLFTYKINEGMPNTTNELDGYFKLIKAKTNIHNGLESERKKKLVLSLFSL